jgi:Rps23 Pro-64 3,4-dihydroxylase Tpa1-like proline 4-hydroxylase
VVTKLEEKLAAWTKFPISHQEDVQILRYQYGQKYGAHWDVFDEKGPRAATVLVYLADKDLFGGETAFPNVCFLVRRKGTFAVLQPKRNLRSMSCVFLRLSCGHTEQKGLLNRDALFCGT